MSAATKSLRCLIVEDVEDDVQLLLLQLRAGGYDVTWERVDTPGAMRAALERQPWDVVLSDYRMPRFSGLEALEILRASGLDLPFIIVSGTIGEETAVAAMQAGVDDYLIKGELAHLTVAVERELRNAMTRRERRAAEAAKAASQQLLEEITDNCSSLIYSLDPEGRFLLVNRAFERVVGVSRETMIGHTREFIMLPASAAAHRAIDLKVMQDGQPLTLEEENNEPDGIHIYLSVKFPLVDASGHLRGIGGISTDITELKRADAALRQQAEELRTKNDVLERFNAAAVGRELRMVELKREMNELCAKLGEPPRFRIATAETAPSTPQEAA